MKKVLLLALMLFVTTATTVFASDDKTPSDKGKCPKAGCEFKKGGGPEFRGGFAGKPDFEDRLKLTDKQKAQIKKNREM